SEQPAGGEDQRRRLRRDERLRLRLFTRFGRGSGAGARDSRGGSAGDAGFQRPDHLRDDRRRRRGGRDRAGARGRARGPRAARAPPARQAPRGVAEVTLNLGPADQGRRFRVLISPQGGGNPIEAGGITIFSHHVHGPTTFTVPLPENLVVPAAAAGTSVPLDIRVV